MASCMTFIDWAPVMTWPLIRKVGVALDLRGGGGGLVGFDLGAVGVTVERVAERGRGQAEARGIADEGILVEGVLVREHQLVHAPELYRRRPRRSHGLGGERGLVVDGELLDDQAQLAR